MMVKEGVCSLCNEKLGQMGVPALDIDGKIIVGFDVEEINKALEVKK